MKPFDDSISEENTAPYQALATLLRQATPVVSITVEEQSQLLARVRARLHQPNDVVSEDISLTPQKAENDVQASRLRGKAPRRRSSRMRYALNMLAAVLVVGVIAGASLWLFTARQSSLGGNIPTGAPVGPIKAPVTVRSEAGGLEASLQVTAGPYFLSELLAATVTLTNHNHKSVLVQGSDAPLNFCNGAFSLATTGGSEPHYNFSLDGFTMDCPYSQTKLDPGKSLMIHGYVPLKKSGHVMLTPGARFLTVTIDHGTERISSGRNPLDGHWPTIQINVATKVPKDRSIALQQQSSAVVITAPLSASHNLVYYYVVTCVGTMGTSAQWYHLTMPILHEPGCSGASKHWIYAISSPGYAVAAGEIFS